MIWNKKTDEYVVLKPEKEGSVPIVKWSKSFLRKRKFVYSAKLNKIVPNPLTTEGNNA